MGCTASKLDNEDTVRRCKERRRLIKDAVYARHHLAAAHSDYCRSLRITGSALTAFAAGEPLSVTDQTPAVLLHTTSSVSRSSTIPQPPPPLRTVPPQPPPFFPSPSPSNVSSKLPRIVPASGVGKSRRHQHRKPSMRLPHILSDSSPASSPRSEIPNPASRNFDPNYTWKANSTYSSTPSQASSVWNWENFYPPSPPDSEYFKRDNNDEDKASSVYSNFRDNNDEDKASSVYSNFRDNNDEDKASSVYSNNYHYNRVKQNHIHEEKQQFKHVEKHRHNHHLIEEEEEEEEVHREEVQCSEWGDHDHDRYSTTTSSSEVEDADADAEDTEDVDSRSEMGTQSNFGSSTRKDPHHMAMRPPATVSKYATMSKSEKSDDTRSSSSWNNNSHRNDGRQITDMSIVVRHRDLGEIVASLKEYFEKAASAGDQVSEMLETSRAQMDSSFRQLKKTVYHSSGMLSNLSSSWTSKPPLSVRYKFDEGSLYESGGNKSLCSTLERLLAWEKKLYQEIKARESVKIEHEKKLSTLQSQECKREEYAKLDKTKVSIKRLQSLIVVTSQAVTTTSTASIGLRDSELVPQLVELCHGFMYMWKSMNQSHEAQNQIVQQVRGLINHSTKGESTSDLHRQSTRDLESSISAWHASFTRLIKFQRDFIRSLHGWFRLTLLPVHIEQPSNNVNIETTTSDAFQFCDEWKLALDRVPDTVASEAIKGFVNVVHSISLKQTEEHKIKRRTESTSKELEKKFSSLRNIERKYYHSYSMVGVPDTGPNNVHGLDARDPLSEKKAELAVCQRRVQDEMLKHSKAVEVTRAMTLNNLQTGLPGVFQAMASFSGSVTEQLEMACNHSYAIKA